MIDPRIDALHPDVEEKIKLQGSLLDFTKCFYYLRTGRDFSVNQPKGREAREITICRALTQVFEGKIKKLFINMPPRYGKTELLINFVLWTMSQNPQANYIYVSCSKELAVKATSVIRDVMQSIHYRKIFGIELRKDSRAKDHFKTIEGGEVLGLGTGGVITGSGAGVANSDEFAGCIIIDDIIQAADASSEREREGANNWYYTSLQSRRNDPRRTPIIIIGQKTHEHDIFQFLAEKEKEEWTTICLPCMDAGGNMLDETKHNRQEFNRMLETDRYTTWAQYQQKPLPEGDSLYLRSDFLFLPEMPKILCYFITADTAETTSEINDFTVFSFWGIYELPNYAVSSERFALVWLDCLEIKVEPRNLAENFINFYMNCSKIANSDKKGISAFIENKSTGVTLVSIMKNTPGMNVTSIERSVKSKSKGDRFISAQRYVGEKRVSFIEGARHAELCISHLIKITPIMAHRHDDIADTMVDAIKLALMDKIVQNLSLRKSESNEAESEKTSNEFLRRMQEIERDMKIIHRR